MVDIVKRLVKGRTFINKVKQVRVQKEGCQCISLVCLDGTVLSFCVREKVNALFRNFSKTCNLSLHFSSITINTNYCRNLPSDEEDGSVTKSTCFSFRTPVWLVILTLGGTQTTYNPTSKDLHIHTCGIYSHSHTVYRYVKITILNLKQMLVNRIEKIVLFTKNYIICRKERLL